MAKNTAGKSALEAGEEFLAETRDSVNALLRRVRSSSVDAIDQVTDELQHLLEQAKDEGERVLHRLRGTTTPAKKSAKKSAAKKSAKKSAAKKTPAKKTAAKKTPAKKTAAKKTPAKKTAAKKTAAKKSAATKRA